MTKESTKDLMQLAGVLFFYVASLANISKGMTGDY